VRQRIEILKALHRDARILVLDSTAVLTPPERDALFAVLKSLAFLVRDWSQGARADLIENSIGSIHHPRPTSLIPRLAARSGLRGLLPREANLRGFGKRNFAARDSPPRPAARGGQTRQMAVADRARPC
jgi:hypothetical protein